MLQLPVDARVVLCDIWGCVHDGTAAFAGAVAALARWRAEGRIVVLVTNAPRPAPPVIAQLGQLGVHAGCYDAVVTSGDAGVALVAARGGVAGFIGTAFDRADLEGAGLRLVPGIQPLIVCTGLEEARPALDHYDADLAAMAAAGATLLCFNPDRIVIHAGQREICAGAIADRYADRGGAVVMTGKPFPAIYVRALALAGKRLGRDVRPDEVVAIGDGIATDLAGAARMGFGFVFVTGGIEDEAIARIGLDAVLADAARTHAFDAFRPLAIVPVLT